jgi:hypothetical protein
MDNKKLFIDFLIKNTLWFIVPFLILMIIFGVFINGGVLIYFILIPLSIIVSLVINSYQYKKLSIKHKWIHIIFLSVTIGIIQYLIVWIAWELNFPFQWNP